MSAKDRLELFHSQMSTGAIGYGMAAYAYAQLQQSMGAQFHDPVIGGKNYVGSSDYQALGRKAANEAREQAHETNKEHLGGISEKKDGSNNYIIIPPIPQFNGMPNGKFHHNMGPKNFSYIDRPDPSPTGYRLVADVLGHTIFTPRISKEDMQSFHFMKHDAFVGVPAEPGTNHGPQVHFYDHTIEPPQ